MIKAIDRLFHRLAATYGSAWDQSMGATPIMDAKTVWAHELSSFKGSLHRIAWALENLPERCPNPIVFKNLCRSAPAPEQPALPEPKADPERLKAELAKLGHLRTPSVVTVGPRDWAHRIMARLADGEKITPTVVQMAKNALGPT